MSIDALAWAFDAPLTGPKKAILVALAWRANWEKHGGDDICFPGWSQLTADSGVKRRALAANLAALELAGYVRINRDAGRGNTYHLQTPLGFWSTERIDRYGADGAPLGAPGSPSMTGAPGAPVHDAHQGTRRTGAADAPVHDAHQGTRRTGPVHQAHRPVHDAHPNLKNLKLKLIHESDVAPVRLVHRPKHPGDKAAADLKAATDRRAATDAEEIGSWLKANGIRH